MTWHKKIYADFFGLSSADRPPCERCVMLNMMGTERGIKEAVDVHHCSARKIGGDPLRKKDVIENLAGVCRECHSTVEAFQKENDLLAKWCAELEVRKFIMRKFMFGYGESVIRSIRKNNEVG